MTNAKMHNYTGFHADLPVFTNDDWKRLMIFFMRNQRQVINRSSVHNVSMANRHRSRPGTRTHPLMDGILSAENDFGILTAKEENQTTSVLCSYRVWSRISSFVSHNSQTVVGREIDFQLFEGPESANFSKTPA